ncbi:MAG: efflux RND transporter periplasmic adaptor subunit [Bryobacteraceae bacterium]
MAAAAAMLLGCSSKQAATPEPVVSVQTATVQRKTIERVIASNALLYPINQATIVPKISAPIRKFYVQRGSHVKAGQLVAALDNKDLAAAVVQNQGAYEQAQATYATSTKVNLPAQIQAAQLSVKATKEAMEADKAVYQSRLKLYKAGAMSRNLMNQSHVAYIQTENQYEIAQAKLKALHAVGKEQQMKAAQGQLQSAKGSYLAAQAQYKYSEIRSPISGVVTDRPLYEGEMASAGTPLMTIMDLSHVVARGPVSPEQAAQLHVGDAATISPAEGQVDVPGKVTVVSPAVNPNTTSVQIWVEAPNADGKLKAGSTVQVKMVAQTVKNALVVPEAAVLTASDGATSVMTVGQDRIAHQTKVKAGIRQNGEVQIVSGLQAGERVITEGSYGLPDGTKVKF